MTQPARFVSILLLWIVVGLAADASLGPYEHGAGIKSQAAGGISYALAEEATPISYNPALAASLEDRNDVGMSLFAPKPVGALEGNLLGFDERYEADGQKLYPIPQGGLVRRLGARWTAGVSLFSAGLGPDYVRSPYQRFGGGRRASLTLVSSGASLVLAWRPHSDHALGFALNPGYQVINVTGLQFLDNELPPFGASATPGRTSDQGYDGSLNVGATFGWHGLIAPNLAGGLSYRSKTWAQRHHEYRGLLPNRGSLELPAIWGGGLAWMPTQRLTLAFDFQRYEFESERALGNRFANLDRGNPLGTKNGPGFGFRNLDAYKFGVCWQAADKLSLRAGYINATEPTRSSETLFNILASINTTTHYTGGFTYAFDGWELSGFGAYAPARKVEGENSIPLRFGGGEANTEFGVRSYGFAVGWGFGD